MDKDNKSRRSKLGFSGLYEREASRFWMSDAFDTEFRIAGRIDYTKLAATQRAIGNFVNIVTGKQIPVVFRGSDSYTDGEHVVIGSKLDGKNFDPAVGLALHEGSHIAHTNFKLFERPEGGKTSYLERTQMANLVRMNGCDPDLKLTPDEFSLIKDLLNWVEDRRIDYLIYKTAPGYRMYYEAMYDKYFNDKVIDKALTSGVKRDENVDCYMFHIINFVNPNRDLNALKRLRDIWNVIDLANIHRLQSTEDALKVACQVFMIIQEATAETQSTTQQTSPQAPCNNTGCTEPSTPSGKNEDVDDSEEDDSDSEEDDSDDSGDDVEVLPELSKKELEKLEKAIRAQQDFLDSETNKEGKLSKKDSQIVNAIQESGTESISVATSEDGRSAVVETIVINRLTPKIISSLPELFENYADDLIQGTRQLKLDDWRFKRIIENDKAVMKGIQLGKQLGSKLQLRNAERTLKTTRLETGKIDRRLISQLGYENYNVFHRVVTEKFKDYFIHISIDASGSMSGNKFHKAITSAVAIAKAASMTTGVRVQISFRGTSSSMGTKGDTCVTIVAYDSAQDKISKITSYFKFLNTFGCTPEGIAFKSIEKRILAAAKGDELIFINYSDGAPTAVYGQYSDPASFTKKVVSDFRTYGINVISYFIYRGHVYESTRQCFKNMYGADSKFIEPEKISDIAKTLNEKFYETSIN
jgi:hypothetical protein